MTPTSSVGRNFPTLRYLTAPFRWVFRSRQRVLTAAAVLLAMIAAPPVWWATQLMGLPEIDEPVDVQAIQSFRIPDESNAFVLYRRAADRLKPLRSSRGQVAVPINQLGPWPKDDEVARRWVEENREAMEIYRQGTERPDALDLVPAYSGQPWKSIVALRSFQMLARLEAGRLERQGDMAGAWAWYRAAVRSNYHIGLRGSIIVRTATQPWQADLRGRLAQWAADRRTTPGLIHRALDDAIACGSFKPSESDRLKSGYPEAMRVFDSPENWGRYAPLMRLQGFIPFIQYLTTPEQFLAIVEAWRFWRREPERGRRLIRLAVANWLAFYDLPPDRRPRPAPGEFVSFDFYAFGPEAPANARALSPEALDRWLETSPEAMSALRELDRLRTLRDQDRADHRALLVLLATELYRRDHGKDPPSPGALVGPYLQSLPDDGSDESQQGEPSRAAVGPVQ
jgi:hypothetical protein